MTADEVMNSMVKDMVALQVAFMEFDSNVMLDMPYGRYQLLSRELVRQKSLPKKTPLGMQQRKGFGV